MHFVTCTQYLLHCIPMFIYMWNFSLYIIVSLYISFTELSKSFPVSNLDVFGIGVPFFNWYHTLYSFLYYILHRKQKGISGTLWSAEDEQMDEPRMLWLILLSPASIILTKWIQRNICHLILLWDLLPGFRSLLGSSLLWIRTCFRLHHGL